MNTLYLITGGNLADRRKNLMNAKNFIGERVGTIVCSSSIYETEAWGSEGQPSYFNQVHQISTSLEPKDVISVILKIEKEMGRIRTTKNASRIIDIDILFYNDEIISSKNLIIPHKEIPNRRFVLMPLNEISPELVHPVLKKSIKKLLKETSDSLKVSLLSTF